MFSAEQLYMYLYCSEWILSAFLKKSSTGIWLFGLSVHPTTLSYSVHGFEKRRVFLFWYELTLTFIQNGNIMKIV